MRTPMVRKTFIAAVVLAVVVVFVMFPFRVVAAGEKVPEFNLITVNGAIIPLIAEYILQNIQESQREGRQGLIILMDTPGRLDLAMRDIAKGIFNAPVPVMMTSLGDLVASVTALHSEYSLHAAWHTDH